MFRVVLYLRLQHLGGAIMIKLGVLRTASFSLFVSLSAPVHAQAPPPPAPTEVPSPLSTIVHDFTTWVNHIRGGDANHHQAGNHLPPLPRPRPEALASATVAPNNELSEFAPAPVPSKNKTSTPVQIND